MAIFNRKRLSLPGTPARPVQGLWSRPLPANRVEISSWNLQSIERVGSLLVGGIPTPLKNISQLG